MNIDKRLYYSLSIVLLVILFLPLIFSISYLKIIFAGLLLVFTFIIAKYIKKRISISINYRSVILITLILSLVYLMIIYLLGIKYGFYKTLFPLNWKNIISYFIPSIIIICSFEIIRFIFISQQNKIVNVIIYISGILVELLLMDTAPVITSITSYNQFMDLIGLTFLPAFLANLLYHNFSREYGIYPNIIYKSILTLYIFIIPVVPGIPDPLMALFKLFMPLIILFFVRMLYFKKQNRIITQTSRLVTIGQISIILPMILIVMLFSCQFKFGAMVIATDSMTGELNRGDIIIYEQYSGENLAKGQIILFKDGENIVVHRIVEILDVDGQLRYYTKGDSNEELDSFYRIKNDIVGYTDLKVPYLGYITIWFREIFD